jgi:hypothetical protein
MPGSNTDPAHTISIQLYSLRYDFGLGDRIQIGLSNWLWTPPITAAEVHFLFNFLKTAKESDFLSIYLNPNIGDWGLIYYSDFSDTSYTYLGLNSGVAYEHRFGSKRPIGVYVKFGISLARTLMFKIDPNPWYFPMGKIALTRAS